MFKEDYIQLIEIAEQHNVDFERIFQVYEKAISNIQLYEKFGYAAPQELGFAKVKLFIEAEEEKTLDIKKRPIGKVPRPVRDTPKTKVLKSADNLSKARKISAASPEHKHLAAAVASLEARHKDLEQKHVSLLSLHDKMSSVLNEPDSKEKPKPSMYKVTSLGKKQEPNEAKRLQADVKAKADKLRKDKLDAEIERHNTAVKNNDPKNIASGNAIYYPSIDDHYRRNRADYYKQIKDISAAKGKKDKADKTTEFLRANDHIVHLLAHDHSNPITDKSIKEADPSYRKALKDSRSLKVSPKTNAVFKAAHEIHKNRIMNKVVDRNADFEKQRIQKHEDNQLETKAKLAQHAKDAAKKKGLLSKVKEFLTFRKPDSKK